MIHTCCSKWDGGNGEEVNDIEDKKNPVLGKFENASFFTLKTLTVHSMTEKFENATILMTNNFGFVFEEKLMQRYDRDLTVFEKLRFQSVFCPHNKNARLAFSKSSCLKSVFGKLCFRDGLVWTVGLTVEIKLCFRDGLVWTVGLTVEIKLCFRDGLEWTVDLTLEIKLCFRDGLVWTVGLTVEIKLCFRDGLVWTVGLTVGIKLRFHIFPP